MIKRNNCWPIRNVVLIPMEETESYYEQLNKYVLADNFIPNENPVILDEGDPVDPFAYAEVEKSLNSCSNGKSLGIDGVTYEDIKANWGEYGNDILRLQLNSCNSNPQGDSKFIRIT